ncbi:AEC family transporter [Thalassomonas actiniarum]|uniref:AEC family transporter n=1 Tax=Thalassomonas actiniarum TaxID=485447 RepID=A0AAE9YM94_9GAMM|nr:AEC family transporter [Thalassomonas actiniarum]WDD97909.1 AEC family transporter [Thalassomonas actiniarum]
MNIISVISPLILVALLGFILCKSNKLNKSQVDALSKFTFFYSIPAFLFYQMANADFSGMVDPKFFAGFYLPLLCCYLLAGLANYLFHKKYQKHYPASAVFALGASYSNTVIVGLPVLLMVIGEQVVALVFLIITFHSTLLFGLTSAIAARGAPQEQTSSSKALAKRRSFDWQGFFKQTFNNPLIISILSGLVFNLLAIPLPGIIGDALVLLGKPAITLALFILGASLAYYQVRNEINFIMLASIFKLMLLPALVYGAAHYLFQLEPMIITVLVILSASPIGVNAYLIAKMQEVHQETLAGAVVVSTVMSVFTVPAWLWFLG